MNGSITSKRRAIHDSWRQNQLEKIFGQIRNRLVLNQNRVEIYPLETVMQSLPHSLPQLSNLVAAEGQGKSHLFDHLIENSSNWIRFLGCGNSLSQWSAGIQVLARLLAYCQMPFAKSRMIVESQQKMVRYGFELIESNKMVKYDILLLILNYYMAAVRWPCFMLNNKDLLGQLFWQLANLNWKTRLQQFVKYVLFINNLVDRAIETSSLYQIQLLFIEDSQVILKLMNIVEQIFSMQISDVQQQVLYAILRVFVNMTFTFHNHKLNQLLMYSNFRNIVIVRINSMDNRGKDYLIQLICNIMVDQHDFREFVRNNIRMSAIEFRNQLTDDLQKLLMW